MSRTLILSKEMNQIVSRIALEAKISEEDAVRRIFALANLIYDKTLDSSITVKDSKNEFLIKGLRE